MVFVGEAVVEVWVGEGLGGRSGLLTAIPPLEVVFPQMNYISAEVGEMAVRDGRRGEAGEGRRGETWGRGNG